MDALLAVSQFTLLDWGVIAAYFAITTFIGWAMAGKQSTFREFFLAGRRIPWYAVAGSIISTEISAVTFVSVPAIMFSPDGDFRYLQLGLIGALLARIIVAFVFVPAYYKREIYSPYDYMGERLGPSVRGMTTAIFMLGAILGQSARVYLTALVLNVCLDEQLAGLVHATGIPAMYWSIFIIGLFSIVWTMIGGIATVIWTDVLLFLAFMVGAFVALWVLLGNIGGVDALIEAGKLHGKFRLWETSFSWDSQFNIWTALFGSTVFMVGVYGTDQLMAQRIFCCKTQRQAKVAIIAGQFGVFVAVIMLFVGLGLFAFYQQHPLTGSDAAKFAEDPDNIFPIFIVRQMGPGLSGLLMAAIFAAAISSSLLAALAQTTISWIYEPKGDNAIAAVEDPAKQRKFVSMSRLLVVVWGFVMMLAAVTVHWLRQGDQGPILILALQLASFTIGALLAGFLLAFLPFKVDGRGFLYAAPLSIFVVFGIATQSNLSIIVCSGVAVLMVIALLLEGRWERIAYDGIALLAGIGVMIGLNFIDTKIAWPWFAPAGTIICMTWGYLLGRPDKTEAPGFPVVTSAT